jgi:hypothetical protein
MSASEALMLLALKETEMFGPFVVAWSRRMSGFRTAGSRAGPDKITVVVVDVWTRVEVAIRTEEDVARGEEFGFEDLDGDDRSVKVGSLVKVVLGRFDESVACRRDLHF